MKLFIVLAKKWPMNGGWLLLETKERRYCACYMIALWQGILVCLEWNSLSVQGSTCHLWGMILRTGWNVVSHEQWLREDSNDNELYSSSKAETVADCIIKRWIVHHGITVRIHVWGMILRTGWNVVGHAQWLREDPNDNELHSSRKAETVADCIMKWWIAHHGIPVRIHSDNAPEFRGNVITQLKTMISMKCKFTSP